MSSKKINSHYIQQALIKRIFPTGLFELRMFSNTLNKKGYTQVASSKKLFGQNIEYIKWIEALMNKNLEDKFIKIVDRFKKNTEDIEISLEDAFLIRKYYAVTWIRINLNHMDDEEEKSKIKKMIEEWTINNYKAKAVKGCISSDILDF